MNLEDIKKGLGKRIDSVLVDEIFKEYVELKKAFSKKDKVNIGIYGGRFSEICIAAIYNLYNQQEIDINKIHFNSLFEILSKIPKNLPEDEILTLNVPYVLKSVYALRNKKRIAHIKSFDPNYFDINYIHDACTWVLSQIILILSLIEEEKIFEIINSMMEKKIAVLQEFEDGSLMILDKNMLFKDEILITLYRHSRRINNEQLKNMLNPEYSSKITTYLRLLFKERLVHLNNEGSIITSLGTRYVEENLLNKLIA